MMLNEGFGQAEQAAQRGETYLWAKSYRKTHQSTDWGDDSVKALWKQLFPSVQPTHVTRFHVLRN